MIGGEDQQRAGSMKRMEIREILGHENDARNHASNS